MSKKKAIKAVRVPLSPAKRKLVASGSQLGYDASGGFEVAVRALKAFAVTDTKAIADFGVGFIAGYMVRYAELHQPGYARRTGNQPLDVKAEAMLAIHAKAEPTSTKADRRTDDQQAMCKAANQSWYKAKTRAGLVIPKKRKPRPSANKKPEPPRDLVMVSPKLATKADANDYFATAAAALLATCDVNSQKTGTRAVISPQVSTACSLFLTAIKEAVGTK